MSLISNTIPNLVNGVSQQPDVLRYASQCAEQVNGFSSVADGLHKRPPLRHIARLAASTFPNAYHHTINRDASERYKVVVSAGSIRVFDLDGVEKTVNAPSGFAYLASADPQSDISVTTVADFTFVVNRSKTVAADPTLAPARPPEALVWVRTGAYKTTYIIKVDAYSFSYQTADGDDEDEAKEVQTSFIAARLEDAMKANETFIADFDVYRASSVIRISRKNGEDFTISHQDGAADQGMRTVKGLTSKFSDLPTHAAGTQGFLVKVSGGPESTADDYYVEYNISDGNATSGVWTETRKGGETYMLAAATMPHTLVREADGTFTFKPAEWIERTSGDSETNPFPSFVGQTIGSVFFHRNRLGFLAGENVVLSKASKFFDFFKDSAYELIDTDPIDVAATHVEVSELRHAVPWNESLLIFADNAQFTLTGGELLTPKSASVNLTTEYKAHLAARPVGAGRNVYFATRQGSYAGVREFYVNADTETKEAVDTTAHVPNYIVGPVSHLSATSNYDMVVGLSQTEGTYLYVYKFHVAGGDKLQSAWSRWEFEGCTLKSADFLESRLIVVYEREGATHLGEIDLSGRPGVTATGPFDPLLDHRKTAAELSPVYDEASNTTTFTLPYVAGDRLVVTAWGDPKRRDAVRVPATQEVTAGSTTVTVSGNLTGFVVGETYDFRYRFSKLIIRPEGSQTTLTNGRVQCRGMTITYATTGYFRVEVSSPGRDTSTYIFAGRTLGSILNRLGVPPLEDGSFGVPLRGENTALTIEVVNDTLFPCYLLEAQWEAFFSPRARRV